MYKRVRDCLSSHAVRRGPEVELNSERAEKEAEYTEAALQAIFQEIGLEARPRLPKGVVSTLYSVKKYLIFTILAKRVF